MRKAGVPESVIMAISEHSTQEMFGRYNTIDMDSIGKVVDRLEMFFIDQNEKKDSVKLT